MSEFKPQDRKTEAEAKNKALLSQAEKFLKKTLKDQSESKRQRIEKAISTVGPPREGLGVSSGHVTIEEYNPLWPYFYQVEKANLEKIFVDKLKIVVEHVGSTAVHGLKAKPIIDIAIGFRSESDINKAVTLMLKSGYDYVPEVNQRSKSKFFGKGQPRLFHIHLVRIGSPGWDQLIHLRNYLRTNYEHREQYGLYKEKLVKRLHGENKVVTRKEYTQEKSKFINILNMRATRQAKFRRYYKYIRQASENEQYKFSQLLRKNE